MPSRYNDRAIFNHTCDGIDRANHIVATYFIVKTACAPRPNASAG